MDKNNHTPLPQKNSRYNGNAFWNDPQPDIPSVPTDYHSVPLAPKESQTPQAVNRQQPQVLPAADNNSTEVHPVITPQKSASSMSTKNLVIIIAAAALVIAALTGVVIFALTSKPTVKSSADPIQEQATEENVIVTSAGSEAAEAVEMISMPACESKSLTACKSQLEDLGIAVKVDYQYNNDVAKDYVISQSVAKGTEVKTGSEVTLTVSKGVEECPYDYQQKLTVTAMSGSSRASAVLYEWKNGDWARLASYNAAVGSNGIGFTREGSSTSPEGLYKLGVVLSSSKINTNLDTYDVTSNTCVVDDTGSSYYNQIMEKSDVPSGVHYDNIGKGLTNGTTYATIYIEHNGNGFSSNGVTKGNGSAIGLRGQYGSLSGTYGDVDIAAEDMRDLLSRLNAEKNPMIELVTE